MWTPRGWTGFPFGSDKICDAFQCSSFQYANRTSARAQHASTRYQPHSGPQVVMPVLASIAYAVMLMILSSHCGAHAG
jgi:hypothetical protein